MLRLNCENIDLTADYLSLDTMIYCIARGARLAIRARFICTLRNVKNGALHFLNIFFYSVALIHKKETVLQRHYREDRRLLFRVLPPVFTITPRSV